jgi:hypothetical protein
MKWRVRRLESVAWELTEETNGEEMLPTKIS